MKAKDYFQKYRPLIYEVDDGVTLRLKSGMEVSIPRTEAELHKLSHDVFSEFLNESIDILKRRKLVRPQALKGLIEEFNNKWNAFCALFVQEYGESPFKRNAFRDILLDLEPRYRLLYEELP